MAVLVRVASRENAYVRMIFEIMIPSLYTGFSLFFLADVINRKIGLLKMENLEGTITQTSEVSTEVSLNPDHDDDKNHV